MNNTL